MNTDFVKIKAGAGTVMQSILNVSHIYLCSSVFTFCSNDFGYIGAGNCVSCV